MPLFRRQSDKGRKRQERQVYLATENPEPTYDLSNCELQEVPSGVFATCRVLHKEALLLNDNWLGCISGGGKLTDLKTLRVLDLHNNELKSLPEEMGHLENLQILNAEKNRLRKIPASIGNLRCLQTLNVKDNKIKTLPDSLCQLPCLRLLDVSHNDMTMLPNKLCHIRTLESLVFDGNPLNSPSKDILKQGTEGIMKFFCHELGLHYEPPSSFLLNVLDPPKVVNSKSQDSLNYFEAQIKLEETLEQYQSIMDKRRQERIELERLLEQEQEAQAQLAAMSLCQKEHLLHAIAQDQEKMDEGLAELSQKKEEAKQRLLLALQEEQTADDLVAKLTDINEKGRKNEELLEAIEKERMEKDGWFDVRWEELQNLRRQEVLNAMQQVFEESYSMESLRQMYTADKANTARKTLEDEELTSNHQVESVLSHKDAEQKIILRSLAEQELLQKEAFEVLQLQKDDRHKRITSQIDLIQQQLQQLTLIEIEKKALRMESEINVTAEKRVMLTALLCQLLDERDKRQDELKKRLGEMEERREDGQTDYWLVQYQRLMDKKPQVLIDRENTLDASVVKILQAAGAKDYIPLVARNRITEEILLQLSDDDLRQMGVHELGIRKAILKQIAEFLANSKVKNFDTDQFEVVFLQTSSKEVHPEPSAPPEPTASSDAKHPSRQLSIVARGINSECVVCMEHESQIIFLNCGHVCCCPKCSQSVDLCPMCRSEIKQKIKLTIPSVSVST
ncbi:E3 ubiquitin-protein ligase LRSAM1-like isoform X2 [Gigantopelta aegis]|uniref:E3 ubiquitin-protein ligase LRSAM1-like isoform X2 n=1 Tax=Gigantopelta aegis TaxID=1735272 RepID=UPI001B8878F6|nr:E3 ubiquitin-protein ligase LRSAM1-like isoform X2 [Gigantopelta aegis]